MGLLLLSWGSGMGPGEGEGSAAPTCMSVQVLSPLFTPPGGSVSSWLSPGAPRRGLGLRPNAPPDPPHLSPPRHLLGRGASPGLLLPEETASAPFFLCPRGLRAPSPAGQSCPVTNCPLLKWGKLRTEGPQRVQIPLQPHLHYASV